MEGLKKEIPFYIKPDTKSWSYLKTAENFSGASNVVYYFKPTQGDFYSSFGVKVTFPSPLNRAQIVEKFDEVLKKSNLEPQGVGLGEYCTKENYVINIRAIDDNGNTVFYGFDTRLDDKKVTSKIFELGVNGKYDGNPKYADPLCRMLGDSFINTWQYAKVKIFFGRIDLLQSKIEQKETILINGISVEFSYQFLADGSQVATGEFQASKNGKIYTIQYSNNVTGAWGVGYESTEISGLYFATIQKIISSISISD